MTYIIDALGEIVVRPLSDSQTVRAMGFQFVVQGHVLHI